MADTDATWDDAAKKYAIENATGIYVTTLHIAENTTILHIGARQSEDVNVLFGDMGAQALGLDALLVVTRELAERALASVDRATQLVSAQRALLGAMQNGLEHIASNLASSSENLTASLARIQDADIAKESLEAAKYKILQESSASLLAQAGHIPEQVLQLLR